ncbi:MAG: hypothetical protein IJ667_01790, partial [Synergistaceae bacterium]|nr:hypothetical protein [Synergistaceae bacterium]
KYAELALENIVKSKQELLSKALKYLDAKDGYQLDLDAKRLEKRIAKILKDLNHKEIDEQTAKIYSQVIAENYKYFARATGLSIDDLINMRAFNFTADGIAKRGRGRPRKFDFKQQQIRDVIIEAANPRIVNSTNEAEELIRSLGILNTEINNSKLGITASISGKGLSKMMSDKAVKKSISPKLHALAVANIDRLFKSAVMEITHPDSHRRSEVNITHRLGSIMLDPDTGKYTPVMITVLEYQRDGNKIYTVEAVDVLKYKQNSAGQLTAPEQAGEQVPITEFIKKIANFAEDVNNGQEAYNQIIGEQGAARLDEYDRKNRIENLSIAREMEKIGKSADRIWLATGWERGADGKWRYEILDGEFHRNGLSKGQLDDFYDAPELYKAYPSLRGVHVVFKDNLPGGAYGVFDSDANTIELNENLSGEVAKHTIIHEIQHAVQGEEGFAHGGGLEIGDQIRSKSNIWAWRLILEYYAKKHPDIAGTTKLADVAIREYAEEMGKKAEDILTKDEMDKGLESYLSGRDDGGYEKSFRLVREENKVSGYDNPNDIKTYGLLAGEVEARNASSRMNMSEAERRLILLSETEDVAREDQIKIFGEDNRVARYNQIGKSRKAEMDAQLKKHRPDLSDEQRAQTIAEIEKLGEENAVKKSANGNPKLEKAALYWTLNDKRGIIRLPKDAHRIIQAFKISEKLHLQPEAIKDMNKFLEEHTTELASLAGRVDPDTVPQFSRKQVLPKGITVYTVEDTEAGQKAVRNIVNTHWGKDAQPWCITETDDKGDLTSDAKDFWTNKYNKTEKRIAFKNGKLLAFSANQTNDVIWTDRLNRETTSIPSLEVTADDLFNDGDTETKTPTFNDTALLDDLFGSDEETQNSSSTISDTTAFDDLFGDSSTTKTETNSSQEDDLSDLFFNQARIAEDNPDTRRGYIDFSEQGKAIIHILQSANKSTVIHETAHLFLQNFRDIVNNPEINLNEAARNDWNALTKWLGIDKIDFSKDLSESDKKLWRNAQEKFAAGAEKYFMDGKAPTSRLKRVFEIIKGWFKAIYEKAREITYVNADGHPVTFNISKDAREVYNHIYSGGENITPSWQSERAANLEVGEADPNEYLTAKKLKNNNFVETTDEADKAAAEAAKAEAAKTAAEAARPVNELGVYTDTESESDNNSDNMLFTNAETEARFRDSRGDIKIRESVRTYWKHIGLKSLGKSSKSGQNLIHAKGTLTRLVQRIGAAISTANNDMRKVIQDLTPDETELFMRKRIVDDLMWRISDKPDAKLPWGLDHETLKSDYERISRLAENNKNVMAAIKADEQAINELNNEMIELAEKLGMSDLSQVLRNPHYFHHEILFNDDLNAFAQANNSAIGTTNSKAEFTGIKSVDSLINTLKGRGYMKKYKGSERDMSSNYLAITADIRGQQLQDLAIMRALLELKERYDIGDKLRAKLNKNKADLSSETYSQDEINDNSYDGEIPEGYTRFDPEAHGLLSVNGSSKLDLLLSKGMEKGAKRLGLSDVAVGQIMKLMQDKENKIWIIPNEVADALKAFAEAKQPASFKKLLRKITKTWKMWQLFGPTQTLKYNLRNVTGDLDAVLAGNPNTLKYVGRAMQELAPVMFGKRAAEGDLKNYIERGADIGSEAAQYFNSGMDKQLILPIDPEFKAVSNELAGIKTAADFKKLSKKAFKLLNKYSIGGIMKLSSYRENILRYATYLSYLEQMQANTDGKPNNWGASLRDEIEAIPDIHDRAYKLSNELLGDYDSISELGMR